MLLLEIREGMEMRASLAYAGVDAEGGERMSGRAGERGSGDNFQILSIQM
jgi:hypothetical protein